MQAMVNYSISRLASCVHEIRHKAGYDVKTYLRDDERGHRFADYRLNMVSGMLVH